MSTIRVQHRCQILRKLFDLILSLFLCIFRSILAPFKKAETRRDLVSFAWLQLTKATYQKCRAKATNETCMLAWSPLHFLRGNNAALGTFFNYCSFSFTYILQSIVLKVSQKPFGRSNITITNIDMLLGNTTLPYWCLSLKTNPAIRVHSVSSSIRCSKTKTDKILTGYKITKHPKNT